MSLNSAHAPSMNTVLKIARDIFKVHGQDSVLDYLSEIASNDYKCPDRCDNWAVEFYNNNEEEIEDV